MLGSLIVALCLCGISGETRTPPALEHFIRAEIWLQRGDKPLAEAELRYALAFDHDSSFLRDHLRELSAK